MLEQTYQLSAQRVCNFFFHLAAIMKADSGFSTV